MTRILGLIAGGFTAAQVFTPDWAQAQAQPTTESYGYGPGMMWGNGEWYGMFFGPLFMVLTLVVVVAAIVVLVRWLDGAPPRQAPGGLAPLDILKERFAKGEIDKEEFAERCRVLGENPLT